MRMWISLAPASLKRRTIRRLVLPRTMESSTKTSLLSLTLASTALSLIRTWSSLVPCPGEMKVLPIYLFFISPMP